MLLKQIFKNLTSAGFFQLRRGKNVFLQPATNPEKIKVSEY
jgi:hypothetical protein